MPLTDVTHISRPDFNDFFICTGFDYTLRLPAYTIQHVIDLLQVKVVHCHIETLHHLKRYRRT